MSDKPTPLSDDDLDAVSGGVGTPGKNSGGGLDAWASDTVVADVYSVMAQFQQNAQEQRNAARDQHEQAMQAEVDAQKGAAEEIRQAATEQMKGAIVQGAITAIASATSLSGSTGLSQAQMFAASKQAEAEKTEAEAFKTAHQPGAQQSHDHLMQQMQDVIKDVRDKLKSIDETRTETNRGIARNI